MAAIQSVTAERQGVTIRGRGSLRWDGISAQLTRERSAARHPWCYVERGACTKHLTGHPASASANVGGNSSYCCFHGNLLLTGPHLYCRFSCVNASRAFRCASFAVLLVPKFFFASRRNLDSVHCWTVASETTWPECPTTCTWVHLVLLFSTTPPRATDVQMCPDQTCLWRLLCSSGRENAV